MILFSDTLELHVHCSKIITSIPRVTCKINMEIGTLQIVGDHGKREVYLKRM